MHSCGEREIVDMSGRCEGSVRKLQAACQRRETQTRMSKTVGNIHLPAAVNAQSAPLDRGAISMKKPLMERRSFNVACEDIYETPIGNFSLDTFCIFPIWKD